MFQIERQTQDKRNEQYNVWARKYPSYITLALVTMVGLVMGIADYVQTHYWLHAILYITSISVVCTALFFLFRFILRDIAKIYPEKIIFCKYLKPSLILLYSNNNYFTEEFKKAIREKIYNRRQINLQSFHNKSYKNIRYVKRLDEAFSWLRDVTRFDDILFESNCVYGFYRNLTAGILIDTMLLFILSIVNKLYVKLPLGTTFFDLGILGMIITFFLTLLSYKNGMVYAKRVYEVFMNLSNNDENN